MKVLIINGYDEESGIAFNKTINNLIAKKCEENDHKLEILSLKDLKIGKCVGCFGCWIKTPGECVIKDDGITIAKRYINSDVVIIVSKLSFGGYSSITKKAIERTIPLISPFFVKKQGITYHKKRYDTYPNLISIGILSNNDTEDEEIFFELTKKNALNFSAENSKSYILYEEQCDSEIEERLDNIFENEKEAF